MNDLLLQELEEIFKLTPTPTKETCLALGKKYNYSDKTIYHWFWERRNNRLPKSRSNFRRAHHPLKLVRDAKTNVSAVSSTCFEIPTPKPISTRSSVKREPADEIQKYQMENNVEEMHFEVDPEAVWPRQAYSPHNSPLEPPQAQSSVSVPNDSEPSVYVENQLVERNLPDSLGEEPNLLSRGGATHKIQITNSGSVGTTWFSKLNPDTVEPIPHSSFESRVQSIDVASNSHNHDCSSSTLPQSTTMVKSLINTAAFVTEENPLSRTQHEVEQQPWNNKKNTTDAFIPSEIFLEPSDLRCEVTSAEASLPTAFVPDQSDSPMLKNILTSKNTPVRVAVDHHMTTDSV